MYLVIFLYFALLIFMAFIKESKLFLTILIMSVLMVMYMKITDLSLGQIAHSIGSLLPGEKTVEEKPRTADVHWD